nr:hypothetical protein [Tanacetum cinerariifolium]
RLRHLVHVSPFHWLAATATSYMRTMISRQRHRHVAGCHWIAAIGVSDGGLHENGPTLLKTHVVKGVETVMPITSVEDKAHRRLEVKARITLMMGIPNEHQLKFNSIKDAKQLIEAIEKRFGELLGEKISHEDVNQKLLRSLSPEWNTHAVVCRNKSDIDTMSMDDLYNNLKIHPDDLEEMDLKWQMAMLTIRARRFLKNIGRKLNLNRNETVVFDKTKVECFNCHKRGHFSRECRALRAQDNKNRESTRRNVPVEITNSSALVSYDGLRGYDWSDQAEQGPNYALMAYSISSSDFEVSTDSNCSKTCLETIKLLKSHNEQLLKDLKKSELMVLGYKSGLGSVEERLKLLKTNKSIYIEDIKLLKVEIQMKDIAIKELIRKLEVALKEKDGTQLTVEKLKNASKSVNKLIDSQIVDNCKKGLGYNAVPPTHIGLFMPHKPDLSYIGLEEFTSEPAIETLDAKTSEDVPKAVKNDNVTPIIKDWKPDDKDESMPQPKIEKKIVKPSVAKGNPQEDLNDKGIIDSGCSRHMIGNRSYLTNYEEIDGGFVTFGDFKLTDESYILLKVPRKDNMYIVDLRNFVPQGGLTYLFGKATSDESNHWHRRLGHTQDLPFSSSLKNSLGATFKQSKEEENKDVEDPRNEDSEVLSTKEPRVNQEKDSNVNSTNNINTVSPTDNATCIEDNVVNENIVYRSADDLNIPNLEEINRFYDVEDDDSGADLKDLDTNFKSTTGGCQFLGCKLISWQCKEQTVVDNSITEAEYVAASTNPTIYTLCVEQFWATTMDKNINGEAQLHANMDGKKVVISEASTRRDLQFGDEGESLGEEDASKQGRICDIDANQDIYMVNVHKDKDIFGLNDQVDTSMFDADKDLQGEEVVKKAVVDKEVSAAIIATFVTAATTAISFDERTMI